MGKGELSSKQRAFIEHYLICWNASEAAKRAGYSAKTARSIGSENLTKPDIKTAIDARLADLQMSADEVLKRLTEHGRGTVLPFIRQDADNVFLDLTTPQAEQHIGLVKKVKTKKRRGGKTGEEWEEVETELELHDAQAALVQIGRHHALFTDKNEIGGNPDAPLRIEYVNDWRGADYQVAGAASGPDSGAEGGEAL